MSHSITSSAFVPVDVGKNVNWFAVYAGFDLSPTIEPRKVRTNRAGLEQLTDILDVLLTNGRYDRIVLGLEPTGIYHENWARALDERYAAYRDDDAGSRKRNMVHRVTSPSFKAYSALNRTEVHTRRPLPSPSSWCLLLL